MTTTTETPAPLSERVAQCLRETQVRDPWAVVLCLGLKVARVNLPRPLRGLTDGETIWIHSGLSYREQRATLAHELQHVAAGHGTRQPSHIEHAINVAAAEWLLPDKAQVERALEVTGGDRDVAAQLLQVTTRVLELRLGLA